jgi:hypothetical protein
MPIADFIEAVRSHLAAALEPLPMLGTALPVDAAELPAVVLSVPSVRPGPVGVGRSAQLLSTGALQIRTTIDLAHPELVFPDATVHLLSADRKTLQLPHSPLVRADGSPPPLQDGDVTLALGGTSFGLVNGVPAAGQFRPDPVTGILTFAAPLPASGSLQLQYSIGTWEVRTSRYQGILQVDVFASSPGGVEALCQQVIGAVGPERTGSIAGLGSLLTASWGAIAPSGLVPAGAARIRTMTFSFDYEHEEPIVTTGGGPITDIVVDVKAADAASPERMELRHG